MLGQGDLNRIWFGCGNFGGMGSSPKFRHAGDSEDQALELLDHARRVGLRRFDTANTYGGGASETVLGKWLRAQGPAFRETVQVATKVGNPNGCPSGETPLSRGQIAHHLDESLRRLGIERIDLYSFTSSTGSPHCLRCWRRWLGQSMREKSTGSESPTPR